MVNIFTALPWLKPFDMLGTDDERNRIATLFSEENGHIISEYFSRRAKIGQMDVGQIVFHNLPKEYEKDFFDRTEALLGRSQCYTQFLRYFECQHSQFF